MTKFKVGHLYVRNNVPEEVWLLCQDGQDTYNFFNVKNLGEYCGYRWFFAGRHIDWFETLEGFSPFYGYMKVSAHKTRKGL